MCSSDLCTRAIEDLQVLDGPCAAHVEARTARDIGREVVGRGQEDAVGVVALRRGDRRERQAAPLPEDAVLVVLGDVDLGDRRDSRRSDRPGQPPDPAPGVGQDHDVFGPHPLDLDQPPQTLDQETTLLESEELDNHRKALASALFVLNDRERRIFETRRLSEDPITLAELAGEFSISRERVRQIEVSAFEKVQNAVKHRVAAMGSPAVCTENLLRIE